MSQVIELGRLRELTLKGSLASPTSITWKGTSNNIYYDNTGLDRLQYSVGDPFAQ